MRSNLDTLSQESEATSLPMQAGKGQGDERQSERQHAWRGEEPRARAVLVGLSTCADRMCVPKRTVDCFAVYPPEPVAFTFTVSAKGLLKAGRNGGVRL